MGSSKDNDNKDHYEGALLEEIRDNVKNLAEGMSSLKSTVGDMNTRLATVEHYTELIPAIQASLIDQTDDMSNLKERVLNLEETAA